MNTNQIISLLLLIGRLITVGLLLSTARFQWVLIKQNSPVSPQWIRRALFMISWVALLGCIVPIAIDIAGLFNKGSFGLLVAYVFSNNITLMLVAFGNNSIYRRADNELKRGKIQL